MSGMRMRITMLCQVAVVLTLNLLIAGAVRSDETSGDVKQWLDRVTGPTFSHDHLRESAAMKQVFREVVSTARSSVVRVLANESQVALGTIVDKDGLILTKASELRGTLVCKLHDGRKLPATLVGENKENDLAILRVDAADLPVIQWRSEKTPAVGSWLATAGPDQLPEAIGVVSAAPRKVSAPKGMLGVLLDESESGPRVQQVMPGSAAERAQLRVDDVITHINGKPSGNRQALVDAIQRHAPGDSVELKLKRGDQELTLKATLSDRNAGPQAERNEFQNNLGGRLSDRRAGFPSALQHDTVLRPNLCGGPILDLDGRAVGINIARAGRVVSYALPVNVIRPFVDSTKATQLAADMARTTQLVDTKKTDSE